MFSVLLISLLHIQDWKQNILFQADDELSSLCSSEDCVDKTMSEGEILKENKHINPKKQSSLADISSMNMSSFEDLMSSRITQKESACDSNPKKYEGSARLEKSVYYL